VNHPKLSKGISPVENPILPPIGTSSIGVNLNEVLVLPNGIYIPACPSNNPSCPIPEVDKLPSHAFPYAACDLFP